MVPAVDEQAQGIVDCEHLLDPGQADTRVVRAGLGVNHDDTSACPSWGKMTCNPRWELIASVRSVVRAGRESAT